MPLLAWSPKPPFSCGGNVTRGGSLTKSFSCSCRSGWAAGGDLSPVSVTSVLPDAVGGCRRCHLDMNMVGLTAINFDPDRGLTADISRRNPVLTFQCTGRSRRDRMTTGELAALPNT